MHLEKISKAIFKAMDAVDKGDLGQAKIVAEKVNYSLLQLQELDAEFTPTVEQIQDIVENQLMFYVLGLHLSSPYH